MKTEMNNLGEALNNTFNVIAKELKLIWLVEKLTKLLKYFERRG